MDEEKDYFRESFNYFKQNRSAKEQMSDSADFDLRNSATLLTDGEVVNEYPSCDVCTELGLTAHQRWKIYSVNELDGVFLIPNPFTVNGQRHWIRKCLREYPRKPSRTNLDTQLQGDDPWSLRNDSAGRRLSWATLGYHHNWDSKVYDPSDRCPFPQCLADLAMHVASRLGFETFEPEAAILNYYNRKSRLGIHNDDSEVALSQPLLSVSFGLTAIFLVGSERRNDKPVPLLLRSGDIVILSGPCRLSYHAVPAILEDSVCLEADASDRMWAPLHQYILTHRINVSVRQVYTERFNVQNLQPSPKKMATINLSANATIDD